MSVRYARTILLTAVVALVPLSLAAQHHPGLKGPNDALQANVTRISQAAERERWQENAAIWNVKAAR